MKCDGETGEIVFKIATHKGGGEGNSFCLKYEATFLGYTFCHHSCYPYENAYDDYAGDISEILQL